MNNEGGRIVRRRWLDWTLAVTALAALVSALLFFDARVRSLVSTRLIERPAEALSQGGENIGSLIASTAVAASSYTADNRPLVTFTVAGLVLLALMLFRKD
jgi:hypothetical protein